MNCWIILLNTLSAIILALVGLFHFSFDQSKGRPTAIGLILISICSIAIIATTFFDKIEQSKNEAKASIENANLRKDLRINIEENKSTRKELSNIIEILLGLQQNPFTIRKVLNEKGDVEELVLVKFEAQLHILESVLRSEVQKYNLLDIPIDPNDSSTAFKASIFLQMINALDEAKLISTSLSNKLLEITKYYLLVFIDPSSITEETVKMVATTTQRFSEEIK